MVKADTNYDKRVFVIIGGGEIRLGVFARCKWSLIITSKIDEFFILNFAGGAAMKAAETLREEGFRGNKLK